MPSARDAGLRALVLDALKHLADLDHLERSPLAAALAEGEVVSDPRALGLQRCLLDLIGDLTPKTGDAGGLLRARYAEGRSVADVCTRSAISKSEYYRRHRRALAALSNLVQARLHRVAGPQPRPVATAAAIARPNNLATPASPATGQTGRMLFVGRETEIDCLRGEFQAVAAGSGVRMVLVTGPAGVGKTRLVEEVGNEAERLGGWFCGGRYLRGVGAAYGPWVDALESALARLRPREAARLADPYRTRLAHVLPSLADGVGSREDPAAGLLGPEDQRQQLHDGLAHLLRGLGERAPLMLLLDDLQWAPSLDLLRHLAGRLSALRVLIVGTWRKAEFEQRAELVQARLDIARAGTVRSIDLKPLDQAQTARLVADRFGAGPAERLGGAVYRRTRGNPFFIEETLRALQDTGVVRSVDGAWQAADAVELPVPDSVRATVIERVGRLGETAAQVLSRAAVLGETFRADDLRSMSGLDDDALGDVLEAALAADLISDCPTAPDECYTFRDEHVRESLYESLSAPRRRRWHLHAGRAVEAGAGSHEKRLKELAHHFVAAGEAEAGARYSFAAGRQAEDLYAWGDAAFHFRHAAALWARTPGHLAERAEACRRLADVFYRSGIDATQAIEYLQQALALYSEMGDLPGQALLHLRLGREYAGHGLNLLVRDVPRALAHLEAAREIADAAPELLETLCEIYFQLAVLYGFALDTRNFAAVARAVELANQIGSVPLIVLTEGLLGCIVAGSGRITEGLDLIERNYAKAIDAGLPWHAEYAGEQRDWLRRRLDPVRLLESAAVAPRDGSTRARLTRLSTTLTACAHTGEFGRGDAALNDLRRTLADAGQPGFGPYPEDVAIYLLRRGDWEEAGRILNLALQGAQRAGERAQEINIRLVLGDLHLWQGQLDQSATVLADALALDPERIHALMGPALLALRARSLTLAGRLEAAEADVADMLRILSKPVPWGHLAAVAALTEGTLRSRQGRPDEADRAFERALEGFQQFQQRWDEALLYYGWGQAILDTCPEDLRARGRALIAKAQGLWAAMGADRYAAICRESLAVSHALHSASRK